MAIRITAQIDSQSDKVLLTFVSGDVESTSEMSKEEFIKYISELKAD